MKKKKKEDDTVEEAMGSMLVPKAGANARRVLVNKSQTNKKSENEKVAEHHQKDADGKVIEHEDTTPSSVEEKTVLEQLIENGREIDAFEAVISYLIDEGFAKSWEEAQDIMVTLKPELVEEVYQNQLKKI
jgi:hypothetical protein